MERENDMFQLFNGSVYVWASENQADDAIIQISGSFPRNVVVKRCKSQFAHSTLHMYDVLVSNEHTFFMSF